MKTEKKHIGLILLIIILAFLVVGLGGYVIYDKFISNTEIEKKDINNNSNTKDQNETNNCDNNNVKNLVQIIREEYDILFEEFDTKYYGTYTSEDYSYNHTLILKDKTGQKKTYNEFEMKIILTEAIANVKGIYGIIGDKLVLYMQPYQYAGWAGDFKWRREFKINDDGSLSYVDEVKDMANGNYMTDMIKDGDIFKK